MSVRKRLTVEARLSEIDFLFDAEAGEDSTNATISWAGTGRITVRLTEQDLQDLRTALNDLIP